MPRILPPLSQESKGRNSDEMLHGNLNADMQMNHSDK
jgi:hypothetical protein